MDRADVAEIERFVGLGSTLNDKYRIERVLGVGGMGAVVAAEHLKLGETVAIKFLLPRAIGQGRHAQRFLREARAASKIRSPHVARVFDVDVRPDGAPFIVMEHLTGETLAALVKRESPLGVERTVDAMLEACEAVAEAHSLGIVHRDLKPANLFVAQGAGDIGLMKVLDFGISKLVRPDSGETETTTGEGFVGSPPYMSPEQLTDPTRVDHRTDIWAIGIILYECLTGKSPFRAENVVRVLALILQSRVPPVHELRADVPSALGKTIERCMAREREARYPDVLSLARDLVAHGTERGRRALGVIEAVSKGQSKSSLPVRASDPPPTRTETVLDTGTLSAAAEGLGPSSVRTRQGTRSKALFPVIGLGLAVLGTAIWKNRSVQESPPPSSASSDGSTTAPSAITALPPVLAPEPALVPTLPSSAASVASAKPKTTKQQVPSTSPTASGSQRGFDPVFDERR
jgi:eukaryotic-like serine/threonine-protein kinase